MSVISYLNAAPKVELHVHLEGAIQPATLLTLAERNNVRLPVGTERELREWFRFRDFPHFAEVYFTITSCLKTTADYELIVHEFGAEMARQNVRYAEVTFSPSSHRAYGITDETMLDGLTKGRERVRAEFGVDINWVFDIVRWTVSEQDTRAKADYTTELAIACQDLGVVALGLGGVEAGHPPEPFEPWFDRARAAGLRSAPHAGEFGGPESVRGAIERLGAERIGHGVRSIDDPDLVDFLAERQIPIEVSPTSNIRLGAYTSYAEHPFRRLHEAGVRVSVNSDDPPLFNTTLNDEVALLHTEFAYDVDAIDELLLDAVRVSFLPEERRAELEREFRAEMQRLRHDNLNGETDER
ncbi:MAG: adenosine deaminase [Thermomicrobiales bacterium]|nr:adenosine deaminase [Thermomicrobiales bacterium]